MDLDSLIRELALIRNEHGNIKTIKLMFEVNGVGYRGEYSEDYETNLKQVCIGQDSITLEGFEIY